MKNLSFFIIVLLWINGFSQNASESQKILDKINKIFMENSFSEGFSDVEQFKLSDKNIIAIAKQKYYEKNEIGELTVVDTKEFKCAKFNLESVGIAKGGFVSSAME